MSATLHAIECTLTANNVDFNDSIRTWITFISMAFATSHRAEGLSASSNKGWKGETGRFWDAERRVSGSTLTFFASVRILLVACSKSFRFNWIRWFGLVYYVCVCVVCTVYLCASEYFSATSSFYCCSLSANEWNVLTPSYTAAIVC